MSDDEPSGLFDIKVVQMDVSRIAVVSDIHSNLPAFEAVMNDLETKTFDAIICLGDLIGYYTKPNEVLKVARERFDLTIMGNHDWASVDLTNPLFKISRPNAQEALKFTHDKLSEDEKKWILQLPLKVVLETPHSTLTLVHGHPTTIFDYIYGPTTKLFNEAIEYALNHIQTEYLMVGHSHIQGEYFSPKGKIYVNPGSVGQPRDNDRRAAYAIVDLETKSHDLLRVDYEVDDVYTEVVECCLPVELGERLRFGV